MKESSSDLPGQLDAGQPVRPGRVEMPESEMRAQIGKDWNDDHAKRNLATPGAKAPAFGRQNSGE